MVGVEERYESLKKIRGMEVVFTAEERAEILGRIDRAMARGWVMWGDEQEEFQRRFAELTGRQHAVTFSSATAALESVFRWLRRRGAKTVCFQANNFPSPVMAALRAGLAVTWADIDPLKLCPGVADLEAAAKGRPFDVLALTWTGGFISQDVAEILEWCARRDPPVYVIEDASHAAGSRALGRPAGSFGQVAVFSLAATKALHTGQGGMLVTDDGELALAAFQMKNYGRTERFQKGQYVELYGFNSHMTELQAAVGNVLLGSMAKRIEERAKLARLYRLYLGKCGITALGWYGGAAALEPNYYKFPVLLRRAEELPALRQWLADRKVELGSSMYEFVTPALEVWGKLARPASEFPRAHDYSRRHTCLPMHNALKVEDVERVGAELLGFYAEQQAAAEEERAARRTEPAQASAASLHES